MQRPGLHHCLIAALLLAAVAALAGLGVQRYVGAGQERRTEEFRALSSALQLASLVRSEEAAAVTAVFEKERPLLADAGALRLMFVQRGKVVPGLNVSRPARVAVSLGEQAEGADDEKLVTLCASLDRQPSAVASDLLDRMGRKALVWRAAGRVVAAWPVMGTDGFAGLAAVEMEQAPAAPSAFPVAAALVGVFAGLFLALFRVSGRPLVSFAGAATAVLLATGGLVARDEGAKADSFLLARDSAATLFVNRVLPHDPGAVAELDVVWTDVFRAPAEGVEVLAGGGDALSRREGGSSGGEGGSSGRDGGSSGGEVALTGGGLLCFESAQVAAQVALDRTFPTVLVLLIVLVICGLVFLPLCDLVQGISTMPGTYAYVAPAMVGMVVLVLVPFLMGVGLGFFNTDYEFVGIENFRDILFPSAESDTNFYFTLGVTVLWTVSNVVLHVVIGLFLALILVGQRVRLRGLFRVLLIVPWAVPNYITALVWKWMFTSQMGAINLMLEAVGLEPVSWFGPSFWTNFFAALATNTWLGFPFMMVVSMGALQSIPNELYEAADMDGASRWQKFRFITLPLLKPALFPAIILGTIWTFNMFNIIFLVTRGRPDNKTNILITEAYRFFAELNQYGVAAAYCVLIFVILLLYTLVTNRVTRATQGAFE